MKMGFMSKIVCDKRSVSKKVTIPPIIRDYYNIEKGDMMQWLIDTTGDEPEITVKIVKQENL